MKTLELWRWTILDPDTGRLRQTTYRMSREDALTIDPEASPVMGSLELRQVPDDPLAVSNSPRHSAQPTGEKAIDAIRRACER